MNCNEIIKALEKEFPLYSAEEWDNPGLLVGRRDREVSKIMVSLDATDEVIDQAIKQKADMLVTHHPMIFGSLKKVNTDDFIGERIIRMIENGISYYAMHTNYDVCAMADLNAETLGLKDVSVLTYTEEERGLGKVGQLSEPVSYYEFAKTVKEKFELSDVRCYGIGDAKVQTIAVCGGSGKSLLNDVLAAGADVFVTGDIDYHTGIDAWAKGLRVIDAGHYGTEHGFTEDVAAKLESWFPGLEIVKAVQDPPYQLI